MTTVRIHAVPCAVVRVGDDYHVIRTDTGAKVAQGFRRFLAIANAAIVLHTPKRRSQS